MPEIGQPPGGRVLGVCAAYPIVWVSLCVEYTSVRRKHSWSAPCDMRYWPAADLQEQQCIVASEDEIAFENACVVTPANATLVRDLNLRVPAGTNLLVTGPNGSGASWAPPGPPDCVPDHYTAYPIYVDVPGPRMRYPPPGLIAHTPTAT